VLGSPALTAVFAIGSTFGVTSAMVLGWWSQRRPDQAPDWHRLAVRYARWCAAALAFVGLALGAVDLIHWIAGVVVSSWQATIPISRFLVAVNALIIAGLVFSRQWRPSSAAAPRTAAGAAGPET
jgi:membrane glycosyltransferase